ncbi:MAG: hypothetical protein HC853_15070 [Anaerolineae bacterium]|nr:hypothetical protein [Anaerolineae bacterium]
MPAIQQRVEATPSTQSPAALPVVQPAFVWADDAAANNALPAAAPALPVIRTVPINVEFDVRNGPGPMPLTSLLSVPTQAPSPQPQNNLLVVHEQSAPHGMNQPSTPMPSAQAIWPGQQQLPYIQTPQTHSTPNPAKPGTDRNTPPDHAPTSIAHSPHPLIPPSHHSRINFATRSTQR